MLDYHSNYFADTIYQHWRVTSQKISRNLWIFQGCVKFQLWVVFTGNSFLARNGSHSSHYIWNLFIEIAITFSDPPYHLYKDLWLFFCFLLYPFLLYPFFKKVPFFEVTPSYAMSSSSWLGTTKQKNSLKSVKRWYGGFLNFIAIFINRFQI